MIVEQRCARCERGKVIGHADPACINCGWDPLFEPAPLPLVREGAHRGDAPIGVTLLETNRASELSYRQRRKEVKRAHGRGKYC